jgi:hypothetical protein
MSEKFHEPPVFGALYEIANTHMLVVDPTHAVGGGGGGSWRAGRVQAHDLVVVLDRNMSWYKILTSEGIVGWAYIVGADTGLKLYEPT